MTVKVPESDPRPSMVAGQHMQPPGTLPAHLANEPTVTMIFPTDVTLNLDDHKGTVKFPKGIQQVPVSLAKHPYLTNNGALEYKPTAEEAKALSAEDEARKKAWADADAEVVRKAQADVDAAIAKANGDIAAAKAKADADVAAAKQKANLAAQQKQTTNAPASPAKPTPPVNLEAMSKAEIVDHAAEVHGLELDPSDTKADLIEQVEDHVAAKKGQ